MVLELIESGYIFVLPDRDANGRRVVFSVARALDPSKHNTSHVVRAHIATFEVGTYIHWNKWKMKVLIYCPNDLLSLNERNGYLAVKRFWDRDPTNHISYKTAERKTK